MERLTARELSEWLAYERESGQLGREWDRQVLREIHYAIQLLTFHFISANKDPKKGGPVEEPKRFPLPNEFMDEEE